MRDKRKQSKPMKPLLLTSKTYAQYKREAPEHNKRIFERYGALVYISEFDRLYGKDDFEGKVC